MIYIYIFLNIHKEIMRNTTWRPFSGCFFSSLQGLVAEDMRMRISAHGSVVRIYLEPFDDPLFWLEIRPCFFLGGGWVPSIIEVIWVPGIYIYISSIYIRVASMGFRDRVDPGQERAIMPRLEINASNVVGRRGRFRGNCFLIVSNIFCFHPKPWENDPIWLQ